MPTIGKTYYANGYQYVLTRLVPDRDVYEFQREGSYIIWRTALQLFEEGWL